MNFYGHLFLLFGLSFSGASILAKDTIVNSIELKCNQKDISTAGCSQVKAHKKLKFCLKKYLKNPRDFSLSPECQESLNAKPK